jgi:hypothetical protein
MELELPTPVSHLPPSEHDLTHKQRIFAGIQKCLFVNNKERI